MATTDDDLGGLDDFDKSLNFDDMSDLMDSDKPFSPLETLKHAKSSVFTFNSDNVKKAMEKSLPDDIRREVGLVTDSIDYAKDVFGKEFDKTAKDFSSLLKGIKGVLPKDGLITSMFDKTLGQFIQDSTNSYEQSRNDKEDKEKEIQSKIDAAIGVQAKAQEIQNSVNNILQEKRTRTTNELLKHIVANTTALREIALTSTVNYQRKHLELQYKQTYLLKDLLQITAQSAQRQDVLLQAITKNTELPDVAKLRKYQTLKGQLLDKGREFVRKKLFEDNDLAKTIRSNIDRKIKGFFNDIRDKIDMAANFTDMAGMGLDAAEGMNKNYMFGDMIGGEVQEWGLSKVFQKMFNTNIGRKAVRVAKDLSANPAELIKDVNRNLKGDNFFVKGLRSILTVGGDLVNTRFNKDYGDVQRENLDQAAIFDGRMKSTINNVIPGYLRLIHSEVRAGRLSIRDEDVSKFEVSYDYNKDDFVKTSSISSGFLEEARTRLLSETQGTRDSVKRIFRGMVDKGSKDFDEGDLENISKAALTASLKTSYTGRKLFHSEEFQQALYRMGYDQAFIKKVLRANEIRDERYDDGSDTTSKMAEIDISYALRRATPGVSSEIKDIVKSGNIRELAKLGIVDYDNTSRDYRLNTRKVDELLYGDLDPTIVGSRSLESFQQRLMYINTIEDKKARMAARAELMKEYADYKPTTEDDMIRSSGLSREDWSYSNIKKSTIDAYKYGVDTWKNKVLPEALKNQIFANLYGKFQHVKNMSKEDWIREARKANDYLRNMDKQELSRLYTEFKSKTKEYGSKAYNYSMDKIYENYGDKIEAFKNSELFQDLQKTKIKIEESALFQKAREQVIAAHLNLKELPEKIKNSPEYQKVHKYVTENFKKASDFGQEKFDKFMESDAYKKLQESIGKFKETKAGAKIFAGIDKTSNFVTNFQQIATDKIDQGLDYMEANTFEDFKNQVKDYSGNKLDTFKEFVKNKYGVARDKLFGGEDGESISDLMNEAEVEKLAATHAENLMMAADNGLQDAFNTINANVPDVVRTSRIYQEAYNKGLGIIENGKQMQDVAERLTNQAMNEKDPEAKKQGLLSLMGSLAGKAFNKIPGSGMIKIFGKIMWTMLKFGNSIERKIIGFALKNTVGLPFRLIWSAGKKLTKKERKKLVEKIPDSEMPPAEKQKFIEEAGDKALDKQEEKMEQNMFGGSLFQDLRNKAKKTKFRSSVLDRSLTTRYSQSYEANKQIKILQDKLDFESLSPEEREETMARLKYFENVVEKSNDKLYGYEEDERLGDYTQLRGSKKGHGGRFGNRSGNAPSNLVSGFGIQKMSEHDLYLENVGAKQKKLLAEKKKGFFGRLKDTFFKGKKPIALSINPITEQVTVEEVKENKPEDIVMSVLRKGKNLLVAGAGNAKDFLKSGYAKAKEEIGKVKTTYNELKESYRNRVKAREDKIKEENRSEGWLSKVKRKLVNGREEKKEEKKEKEGNWKWLKWFGMAALGLLGKAWDWIKRLWRMVKGVPEKIVKGLGKIWDTTKGVFGTIGETIKKSIIGLANFLWDKIKWLGSSLGNALSNAFGKVKDFFSFGGDKDGKNKAKNGKKPNVKPSVPDDRPWYKQVFSAGVEGLSKAWEGTKNLVGKGVNAVKSAGKALMNIVGKALPIGVLTDAMGKIAPIISNARKFIGKMITTFLRGCKLGAKIAAKGIKVLLKIIIKVLVKVGVYASTFVGNFGGLALFAWDLGWIGYYTLWRGASLIGSIIYQLTGFDIKGEFEEDEKDKDKKEEAQKQQDEFEKKKDSDVDEGKLAEFEKQFESVPGSTIDEKMQNAYIDLDDNDNLIFVNQSGAMTEEQQKMIDDAKAKAQEGTDVESLMQDGGDAVASKENAEAFNNAVKESMTENARNASIDPDDYIDIEQMPNNNGNLSIEDAIRQAGGDTGTSHSPNISNTGGSSNTYVTTGVDNTKELNNLSSLSSEGNKIGQQQTAKLEDIAQTLVAIQSLLANQQRMGVSSVPTQQAPLNVNGTVPR